MPFPKRLSWLPLAVLAVILASALAFLYARTRGHDIASYFKNVASLRQIQQLDARWELDTLKSKIGINNNYDSLADHMLDLKRLWEQLTITFAGQGHEESAALAAGSAAFVQAMEGKFRLVEQFKSHNSVLRNSLAFLPTAAADIEQSATRAPGNEQAALRQVAAGVNQALLSTLVYSQSASDERVAEIEANLDRLTAARGRLPAAVGAQLDIFALHVRTILREHQVVNGLLNRIAVVPVAERVDDIDKLLRDEQQRAVAQGQHYRQYLMIFSVVLIALLAYAAAGLIHSHAVINRVNRELEEANASLEERVQQRTRELHAVQDELVATARQAGMAEIATNVLHSVGNVLNSVNVSAGVVSSQVRASKAPGLARAVQLLNQHAADLGDFLTRDEKGKQLPGYLNKLAEVLTAEQHSNIEELGQLTRSVDHIKDIVATQQSYAGAASLAAPVQIRELVEDALRMHAEAFTRNQVTVVKEFADLPLLSLDRHRLLQILLNLIGNARQAMDAVLDREQRITLGVDIVDGTDERRLRIRVADQGEGIAPENLSRIFAHGFTTRKNGHGFGLHGSALAAKEMGGTLSAHSDGPGQGATFTLLLPAQTECIQ